ncbi:ChaN family lipoprotein [uncultured Capnocytophaga sp.]|uniref:ChaN family lipoprotein n=1 Tax=uncultured Capnocytophaga sp. TaxID=159273 RepID=UPI00260B5EE8|nr:ChaN family lipoprotein [uncultured Capnocytophaga sp.]
MKKYFFLFLFLTVSFSSFSQGKKAFVLFDKKGKITTYKRLLKASAKADIVLFGEYHNNPIAHWLQLELIKDLEPKRSLILGAEMFERDNQKELNSYLQGTINQKALDSLARLWNNYKTDYKPLVDFALNKKIPFIATNIPRKYASLVYKKGLQVLDTLPINEKQWIVSLPMKYDGTLSQYQKMRKMMAHMGENLPIAQAIKDATMAETILRDRREGSLFVHFNGSYHSDFYQGIYWYLQQENPHLQILTITTLTQSDLKKLNKEAYRQADFILVVDEDMTTTF